MDDEDETITADIDFPITPEWLNAAYDALFRPLDREDVDLGVDPDDYPVI